MTSSSDTSAKSTESETSSASACETESEPETETVSETETVPDSRVRPAALGRWVPPENSVTWTSGWSVDPRRAARGYAIALVLLAGLAGGATSLVLARTPRTLASTMADTARVYRHFESLGATLGAALVALMTLGTTKRCFGFGMGTAIGATCGVAFSFGVTFVGEARTAWLPAFALALVAPWLTSWVAIDERRRVLAAFAWSTLSLFVVDVAREGWGASPLDAQTLHRLVARGGLATGAALGVAGALFASRRTGA
jgi:hypothetical protein